MDRVNAKKNEDVAKKNEDVSTLCKDIIIIIISRRAYVTLSQHGYRVLTTKKMVILDLDARNNITPDAIVNDFIHIWEGNGIEARIYRTANGVRVFLMHYNIGRNFSHALKEIMRS